LAGVLAVHPAATAARDRLIAKQALRIRAANPAAIAVGREFEHLIECLFKLV
jgi:hypothetical protein